MQVYSSDKPRDWGDGFLFEKRLLSHACPTACLKKTVKMFAISSSNPFALRWMHKYHPYLAARKSAFLQDVAGLWQALPDLWSSLYLPQSCDFSSQCCQKETQRSSTLPWNRAGCTRHKILKETQTKRQNALCAPATSPLIHRPFQISQVKHCPALSPHSVHFPRTQFKGFHQGTA